MRCLAIRGWNKENKEEQPDNEGQGQEKSKRSKKEKRRKLKKPIVDQKLLRVIVGKEEEEEEMKKVWGVKEMVSKKSYKWLKIVEKEESERVLTRKTCKDLWSCHRSQEEIWTEERKNLFLVEDRVRISQMSYSLVVILELNNVSEIQYKDVMITDDEKYQQE